MERQTNPEGSPAAVLALVRRDPGMRDTTRPPAAFDRGGRCGGIFRRHPLLASLAFGNDSSTARFLCCFPNPSGGWKSGARS